MKRIFLALLFTTSIQTFAQELNCQVSVLTPTIQATDKSIYTTLEQSIREFVNNRKWTNDNFLNQERIECSMIINITARNNDDFVADVQVQSRRPVFKTSYNSTLLNIKDNDFNFKYLQDQTLEYNEGSNTFNLTNLLAYYANVIIGMDYDSFSPEGGTLYFQKAQTIVNNSQQSGEKGWKAFENQKNRYWLVENLLNVSFKPMRSCLYNYHRNGFDMLSDKMFDARNNISLSLKDLRRVFQDRPNSYLFTVFFNAKSDEIVSLYKSSNPDEKTQIVPLLNEIDPSNISKYNTITAGR